MCLYLGESTFSHFLVHSYADKDVCLRLTTVLLIALMVIVMLIAGTDVCMYKHEKEGLSKCRRWKE